MENLALKKLEEEILKYPRNKRKAIKSKSRFLRIIAGAGAGKTTTLALKIVYLLCHGAEPKSIVAFTFTEKAAQNMKNKIFELVHKIKPELYNKLGDMYIGTIHSFCFQNLQDYFGYGNYDVLDGNQEAAFILRKGWGLGLGINGNYTANCLDFLKSVSVVYDELIPQSKLKKKSEIFQKHLKTYEEWLEQYRFLVFSKMVELMVKKITENKKPLSHIKHLIVDEYQDINKAQQALISLIGKWAAVYAVGDTRQCIYQWRGSDKVYFDKFLQIFNNAESINIPENFRSDGLIVEKANLFANTLKDKYASMIADQDKKDKGEVVKIIFETPDDEANSIAKQIEDWIKKRICNYSSISILLRSVKTSGKPIIDALKKKEIPYVVGGKLGLFQREEAQLVGMLFAWAHEQGFWSFGMYNSNKLCGDALLKSSKSLWKTIFKRSSFPEKILKRWKDAIIKGTYSDLTEAFQELIVILGFVNLDINDKKNAAILANLGRFNELLTDFQTSILLGGSSFKWDNDLKNLSWFMASYGLEAYEERPSEDIRGLDAVQIMTIHQAKGLEWPIVFVPSLTNRRFPSRNIGKKQKWDVPRDLFPVSRYEGDLDDERRLFYVTITRAKKALYLSYFRRMGNSMKESPFLEELKLKEKSFGKGLSLSKIENLNKEDEIQTFSPGELIDYCRCNYCYKLKNLWGYQSKFDRMLGFGKSLHHTLRRVSEIVKEEKIDPEKAVDKIFDKEGFHLPFADKVTTKRVSEKARQTLQKYVKIHKQDILNIAEVESRVEFPLEKATIAGRVDVILGPKNSLEVRDYKTSDLVTSEEEAAFQVKLYSLGLNLMDKKIHKGSIAYIKELENKTQIIDVNVQQKSLGDAERAAIQTIREIKQGICKPKKNEGCENRDFIKLCKYANKRKIKMKINIK